MALRKPRALGGVTTAGAPSDPIDVLVVEEYIPEYRRRFFELLEAALESESIRLTVAVGVAHAALAARSDAVADMPFVQRVQAPSISVAGRSVTFKKLSQVPTDPELVVVDQALRHLETYPLLLRQRWGPKVALWGHGSRHAKSATLLERVVERQMTRSADWFFAYTKRGADHVARSGFPRERITVVQNTIDVSELAKLRQEVSIDDRRAVQAELDLPARNVCLYVGALDPQKRIGFLLEACSVVAARLADFALVIAGDGAERGLVEESLETHSWLRYVGRANESRKARLGAASDVLLMPGSVGLVAVDSFALQAPLITTLWPYHGPEADYLEDGVNARISGDSVTEFAQAVEHVLEDRDELARLKAACGAATARYSLETMVSNFAGGVLAALETSRR